MGYMYRSFRYSKIVLAKFEINRKNNYSGNVLRVRRRVNYMSNTKTTLKRRLIAGVALALTAVLALSGCGSGSAEKTASAAESNNSQVRTIHVVTSGSPAPYVLKDAQGNLDGQNIALLKEIFKRLPQYKVEYSITEFKSLFLGLDSGRYQIVANNFAKTPERQKKYLYSTPIYENRYVVVVSPNSGIKKIESFDDLAGKTTVSEGAGNNIQIAQEEYNKNNPDKKINIKYASLSLADELRQVEDGKFDFVIVDQPIYGYYKKTAGLKAKALTTSEEFERQLHDQSYSYFGFAQGEEQLRDDVNEALQEIISDGTSKKIDEQWFGLDLTPSLQAK